MAQKDDIYKKDSVPLFARSKYKKGRNTGSVDRHPDVASNSRRSTGAGTAGGGGTRFERRMEGQSRSRSGRGGSSKGSGRSSRTQPDNKTNYVIVGVLLFAIAAYMGILGYVRMKGRAGVPSTANQGTASTEATSAVNTTGSEETIPEVAENVPMPVITSSSASGHSINTLIKDWKDAYGVIKAVDTPLNTASAEDTIVRLEKQLEQTPNLLDLKVELASRYLSVERYAEAAGQLADILSAEPHNAKARHMLAESFMEGKDYESAIQVSNWILEDDKFSTEARTMLANAYMKLGNYPKAIDYLRALADENSLDIVIQNNLGVAHSRMKQYDLAARIFEKTIRIDKANAVGYFNLAICFAQQNQSQKACDQIYAAAEQFGPSFVAQWTTSKQFTPIADTAPFERLAGRFRSYINDTSTDATGLLHGDEKPTAPFGSAALPGFNLKDK